MCKISNVDFLKNKHRVLSASFLLATIFLDLVPKYYRPWLYQTNSIWPIANGITAQQLVLGAERTPANTILVIVTT